MTKAQQSAVLASNQLSDAQKNVLISELANATGTSTLAGAQATATGTTVGLGAAFEGLIATLTPLLPVILAVGAAYAAIKLEEHFNPSYDSLKENADNSLAEYQSAKQEVEDIKSQLDDVNSQIDEINANTLTIASEAELNKLQSQKSELEQTLKIKEQLADADARQAASDAHKAMNAESATSESTKQTFNDTFGKDSFMSWFANSDMVQSDSGIWKAIRAISGNGGMNNLHDAFNTTDSNAITSDIEKIKEYQKTKEDLDKYLQTSSATFKGTDGKIYENKEYKTKLKELEDTTSQISDLETDLSTKQSNIAGYIEAMTDDNGKALDGYESDVRKLKDSLNEITHYDTSGMSDIEKEANAIDKYFGSSSGDGIQSYLQSLAEGGADVNQLKSAFESLGGSIDGVSTDTLTRYFEEMKSAADDAANSVEKVDGSIEGVGTAFDSANAGDNFVKMKDYIDQANKLLTQGLTGTDDFKTVEKMITQGTGKSYQEAVDSLQRYFTTDQNEESEYFGQLTRDGVQNFVDDFQNLGTQFKTTGEAAKAMGISTEVFEACLGRVSDYNGDEGFEGVKNTFKDMVKSSEKLSAGQTALANLKTTVDSLGKDNQFGDKIEGWEKALDGYEDDISTLDPKIIAEIEFQYDLASLQQKIDEAQAIVDNGGTSQDYANLLATKQSYNNTAEKGTGFNQLATEQIPVEYTLADNDIANLQSQLKGATEEEKVEIQAKISNIMDIQNDLLDAFSNSDYAVSIDANSSIEEVQSAWNAFLQSDNAKNVTANITEVTDSTGASTEVPVTGDVTSATDSTGGSTTIDANGNITSATDNTGVSTEVAVQAIAESLNTAPLAEPSVPVILTPTAIAQSTMEANLQATQTVDQVPGKQVPKEETATQTVNQKLGSTVAAAYQGTLDLTPNVGYVKTDYSGTLTLNVVKTGDVNYQGTAHSNGTALVQGTAFALGVINNTIPKNVFSNERYRTAKDQMALTGELGQELVVSGDKFFTVGDNGAEFANIPKNSIVFNHKQTSELFKRGFTNGRGVARTYGTTDLRGGRAYAAGGIVGNISAINAPNKDKDDDSFSEIFDHVEILLDRMERSLSKLTDSIETYSDNLSKQNSVAQDAINQTRNSLATLQNARDTHMAQADAVELDDNWKNVIKNGELRISEITDEGLKQKLDDYKKYYELYLDETDKIAEYQKDLLDLAQQKLDNIEKYYQNRYEFNDDFGYKANIDELKKALDEYRTELSNQIDAGIIKQYSNEWFEAMKSISEQTQTILEETWNQLQYVVDGLDRVSSQLDNINSLEESKGNTLSEEDYQNQIDTNNKSIEAQYALRAKYLEQMNVYDVGSSQYEDLADKISKCDDEIFGLTEDNEKLKDSIWEARFTKPLEDLKDAYSQVIDEADQFRGLIDKDSMVAKDGSLTSNGLANIAMIMQGMNASKQIVATYTEALKKLDEALKNGTISQSEYDEQQKDILETINDSAGATVDYKNELIDIYKEMAKSEVDSQNKRIDKMKEYMGTEKEAYEYSEKIRKQSKSANQLKSQIAALQGVTNQSAVKELKRLQQELSDQEKEITDTKKDHEYTLRVDGLDSISDSLSETLDNTLDEITYNAEKQEEIVKEMLGNVLNNYKDVYGKINGIINNTGFQFGDDNKNNISNIGTSEGANNQFDSAITAQPDVKPDDTITDVDTGNINDNTTIDDIVSDISKPIDTENRKVAELTLSKSSMTIQEGGAGSLTVGIRPTDAKNKTVIWTSSNPSVATISSGSVKALKPGSTTITVSSTDGSGLSATCTVSVTEKPKPAPPAPSSGGDGRPYVGDICTLNGSYYYDSWGTSPAGSLYSGVPGGVIIDGYSGSEYGGQSRFHGGYGVHIGSADGIYRDLGWVSLNQLSGYATGTRNATAGLHRVDELGNELKIKSINQNGKKYTMLEDGDGVLKASMTSKLFDFAENPTDFIAKHMSIPSVEIPSIPDITNRSGEPIVNNYHYDSLLTVNGDIDKEVFPGMKKVLEESWQYNAKKLLKSKNR